MTLAEINPHLALGISESRPNPTAICAVCHRRVENFGNATFDDGGEICDDCLKDDEEEQTVLGEDFYIYRTN